MSPTFPSEFYKHRGKLNLSGHGCRIKNSNSGHKILFKNEQYTDVYIFIVGFILKEDNIIYSFLSSSD